MLKPVKSVIASARAMMRRPSEAKLATEDMRLFLHQVLEELHTVCLKENADFFTHDLSIQLVYNTTTHGYTFVLPAQTHTEPDTEIVTTSLSGLIPVFLSYQNTADDPDHSPWIKVQIVKLSDYISYNRPGRVGAAFIGNDWQGLTSPQFKLNVDPTFIDNTRWRVACRVFPTDILDYDDTVPFPAEHTSLIEHSLALKCLPMVRDDSPSWRAFQVSQTQMLLMMVQRLTANLIAWINKDVENRVITNRPYHYRYNNALLGPRRGPLSGPAAIRIPGGPPDASEDVDGGAP